MRESGGNRFVDEYGGLAEMLNDCSIDRLMAIDREWTIIAWNKTSELTSGIPKSEVIGKNVLEAFPQLREDDEIMQAIEKAMQGHKSFLPACSEKFNRDYFENHFIPIRDEHGELLGVMNLMHDVAHRIKVEKQLQNLNNALNRKYDQLEKATKELAMFTQITSQDIKEPLKHVYTSIELLVKKEGANLSNMSKGGLRRTQGLLNKMNLLLDDILTVAGMSVKQEQLQPADLQQLLTQTIQRLQQKIEEANATIEHDTLPVVKGYPEMLKYLLYHLLDNAIKFHKEDVPPKINITARPLQGEVGIQNSSLTTLSYLNLAITDNGIGFPQEEEERISKCLKN